MCIQYIHMATSMYILYTQIQVELYVNRWTPSSTGGNLAQKSDSAKWNTSATGGLLAQLVDNLLNWSSTAWWTTSSTGRQLAQLEVLELNWWTTSSTGRQLAQLQVLELNWYRTTDELITQQGDSYTYIRVSLISADGILGKCGDS